MSGVVSVSQPTTTTTFCSTRPKTDRNVYGNQLSSVIIIPRTSDSKLKRLKLQCNSSTGPGSPGSGEGDSRSVLDAFFLGKALAEALNERVESAVGEFLSTIGRLQAEQQKQVQDLQEEVFERAKRAKEKAAREVVEAKGLVSKSIKRNTTSVTDGFTSASAVNAVTPADPRSSNLATPAETDANPADEDPVLG
ncbi:hypothetical protein CFOL_v3_14178 [Cephalotus follicularis]|uniref:Uncharacterized protein n=1 Tax=Cephalotus follicularis TaxID=3775 RepID=A0A1Q3BRR7_CEPFO|nr:hypothetical protein CFOL_v3_14178 [Cephalotus follicularis]